MFKDLLNEIKGFEYQITLKVFISKYKKNRDVEFNSVCFNSAAKIVIGPDDYLDKSFKDVFSRIDSRMGQGSGWILLIDAEYFNISIYSPLSGISYIELHH